mgnify:FL=1
MEIFWLLLIPLYILMDSAVSFYRLRSIYADYCEWLGSAPANNIHLRQKRSLLKQLLTHANVSDAQVPIVEPMEMNHVMSSNVSALDNFPAKHKRISSVHITLINDALGVYKERMWNSFNPLWWVSVLVFFPRSLCVYLGVEAGNLAVKIVQVLWWLAGIVFTVYKLFFPENLKHLLQGLYHTLIP